ncbi:MAG: tRNA (adenosine(37)-N6)-threonylcarbamoyltransferase complex dimerization subunit type 1 TsaB [Patescibacteria group bacterium]
MYIFINTSNHKHIFLALINKKGDILISKKIKAEYQQSEKLLLNIEKILLDSKKKLQDLKGVVCITGPGGFTSLRIGITTANTIAWVLHIPIIGLEQKENQDNLDLIDIGYRKIIKLKKFKQVLPRYGKEPNITIKR